MTQQQVNIAICKELCGPYATALGHKSICPIRREIEAEQKLERITLESRRTGK